MSVPNTNTFTLQDVVNEIGLGSQASLQECFSNATGSFDPTYEGNKDNLYSFRNYQHVCTGTTLINVTSAQSIAQDACDAGSYPNTWYHSGGAAYPLNGDIVYSDSGGCNPVNGGLNWYYAQGGLNAFRISVSGVVGQSTTCL